MSQSPKENEISEVPPDQYNSEPLPGLFGEVQNSWKLFLDPRVPAAVKLLPFLLVAVYFLVPVDFVPDPLLGAGQVDDLGILIAALVLFRVIAPNYIDQRSQPDQVVSHTVMAASVEAIDTENGDDLAAQADGDDAGRRESPPRAQQPQRDYRPPSGPVPAAPVYVNVKGQSSCSTIVLVVLIIILIALVVVLMTGIKIMDFVKSIPQWILSNLFGVSPTPPPPSPTPTLTLTLTPTPIPPIIIQLKTVGELGILHHTAQMVMDENRHDCVVGEERLLYIAHGEALIGFDLKKMKEDDITVDGRRVALRLPPATVLHAFLDVEESRVYDYQKPFVCPNHIGEMIEAAQVRAKEGIEAAADSEELREMAETYGRTFLQLLLFQLGFEEVEVIIVTPEIEGIATPLTPGIMEEMPTGEGTAEVAETSIPTADATDTPTSAPTVTQTPVPTATHTTVPTATPTPVPTATSIIAATAAP